MEPRLRNNVVAKEPCGFRRMVGEERRRVRRVLGKRKQDKVYFLIGKSDPHLEVLCLYVCGTMGWVVGEDSS